MNLRITQTITVINIQEKNIIKTKVNEVLKDTKNNRVAVHGSVTVELYRISLVRNRAVVRPYTI